MHEGMSGSGSSVEATQETYPDLPKEGEPVKVTKQSINESSDSAVAEGRIFDGVVLGEIAVGNRLEIGTLSTSVVQEISREDDGCFVIKTGTSVYRLERRSLDKRPAQEGTEGAVEVAPDPLHEGERVIIQKVSMLDLESPEGGALKGVLRADMVEGVPLAALTDDDQLFDTSVVKRINFDSGRAFVQTASGSMYRVERAG